MTKTKPTLTGLMGMLRREQFRVVEQDGQIRYAAMDVAAALAEAPYADAFWFQLLKDEPRVQSVCEPATFSNADGTTETFDSVDLEGVFRLAQVIDSPKADRIKDWLASSARQRVEEAQNPELAALRARKLYEHKGYSRRWVDKRLRGISARQELTGEWYKRGVSDSEEFRDLTNELMQRAFGMDVEGYRRYKGLSGANQNLRDHMTDLELALTSLGETTAVALHQSRNSHGAQKLSADAKDAGEIVAATLAEIERRGGRPVVVPANNAWAREGRRGNPQHSARQAVAGDVSHGRGTRDAKPAPEAQTSDPVRQVH